MVNDAVVLIEGNPASCDSLIECYLIVSTLQRVLYVLKVLAEVVHIKLNLIKRYIVALTTLCGLFERLKEANRCI